MILTPHIISGLVIAKFLSFNFWVILFIVLFHYLLDIIPHWEYIDSLADLKRKMARVVCDILIGLTLAWFLVGFSWWYIVAIFFSILPDFPLFLLAFIKNNRILEGYFHFNDLLHFWHRTPAAIGIITQLSVVIISIFLLKNF